MEKLTFKGTIPPELIDSIKNNKCILFVGSGLSASIERSNGKTLPIWGEFLIELLEWAKAKNSIFWNGPEEIEAIIKKGNYLLAAQELQECVQLGEFAEFLNTVFRDRRVRPSETHKKIHNIPFRCILTTNYDTLIEGAYTLTNNGQVPVKFIQEDLKTISSPLRKEDFFIFKIHGDIDRPDSIVLGSRSYNQLLFRTPEYLHFLETLFTTHTVLFVGFSGSDVDLDFVIDRLSTIYSRTLNKHYILLPETKYNLTEKRRLLLDRRLEVIEYQKDDSHSQVNAFFNRIDDVINKKNPIENETNEITKKEKITTDIFIVSSKSFHDKYEEVITNTLSGGKITPRGWGWYFGIDGTTDIDKDIFNMFRDFTAVLVFFDKQFMKSKEIESFFELMTLREIERKVKIIPIATESIEVPPFIRKRLILIENEISKSVIERIIKEYVEK